MCVSMCQLIMAAAFVTRAPKPKCASSPGCFCSWTHFLFLFHLYNLSHPLFLSPPPSCQHVSLTVSSTELVIFLDLPGGLLFVGDHAEMSLIVCSATLHTPVELAWNGCYLLQSVAKIGDLLCILLKRVSFYSSYGTSILVFDFWCPHEVDFSQIFLQVCSNSR